MAAEVALAGFSSIVGAAKYLVKKIQQETSCMFKYQSYIDGLKKQVEDLGYKREMVEQPVNHARQQGDEIYKGVEDWLKSVDDFTEKVVKPINGYEDGAKKRCFEGSCPNLFKRYSLSKKAEKAAKEGADLLARGNFPKVSYRNQARDLERKVKELEFSRQRVEKEVEHAERQGEQIFEAVKDWLIRVKDFSDKAVNASEEVDNLLARGKFPVVSYPPAPDRTKLKDYEQFDSRMKVFEQVMEALKDNKFNIIGVYGMGGVGKTTLVKHVANQVVKDKLFDEVVMAELTQTSDHMAIQKEIARRLGMQFDEVVMAERLRVRLKGKRVLIVLDNIWKKIELEDVGIPSENVEKDGRCTIILTSRRQDLLSNQMNSRNNFSIETLSNNEAWQLFEKIVGDSAKQSDFQPTAVGIVERCGGLPVALITVANALKNKRLPIWKDALKQLRSSNRREIPEMDANVYSSIELSYNFLESNEAKSLFLLCGQFSEGHPINVRCLIRYAMGLGLFENVYTLEEGRNRVHTLIDTLKTSCLLLDGEDEDKVKMHDIIHVVAVLIAAEKHMFNITNAEKLKKEIEKIKQKGPTTISLSCKEDEYELPEQLECPQLKLLLFTKGDSSGPIIPDLFFEGMKELQVLHLDDIDCVPSLPSSLGCLINLKTLCLENCELEDIAIVGQLRNLEILSFRDSNIQQLPLEIGQLTGLQLLDLSNCWWLEVIASNVISRLSRLEELYMDSFIHWEKAEGGGENASLVELKGLSKLTTLEICIPDAEIIPQDLVSIELERYMILIGDIYERLDKYKSRRSMLFSGLGIHKMKMLLKGIEVLDLNQLEGFPIVVHELDDNEGFPLLKHLHIENCSEILHIVSSVELLHCQVFPMLESLYLSNLINLEQVCQRQLIDNQSFSNLRVIKVVECVRLKQLFSFSMTQNLLHLQEVEVSNCDKLKMIFGPNMEKPKTTLGIKEIIAEDDLHEKVIFPNLKKLKLEALPKLTSFVVRVKSNEFSMNISEENIHHLFHEKVGFSRLEVLLLNSMDKLRQIWHHQLASDSFIKLKKLHIFKCDGLTSIFPSMVNFTSLEELNVSNCGGLKYLFSYSMINNFPRLQHLVIWSCDSMEVVVGRDEGKLIEIVFPKLHYLQLSHLPKLTSFTEGINSVKFPSLLKLDIGYCDNLRRFISTNSSEDNTQHFFDEKKLKKISVTHHTFSICNIKVGFPRLEVLSLMEMVKLRQIWHHQLASDSFIKLKKLHIFKCDGLTSIFPSMVNFTSLEELNVSNCGGLKYLFSYSMINNFPRLQHLVIWSCDSMEVVVGRDEGKLIEIVFPKLHYLQLSHLPKLTSFTEGINSVKFPSLLKLDIGYCDNLRRFISTNSSEDNTQHFFDEKKLKKISVTHHTFSICNIKVGFPRLEVLSLMEMVKLRQIWHHQLASDSFIKLKKLHIFKCDGLTSIFPSMVNFTSLEELNVSYCGGLKYLFSYSMVNNFPRLQRLVIESCDSMEVVVGSDEGKLIEIIFPKLHCLEINGCSNLRRFISTNSSEDNTQSFFDEKVALPNLMTLSVSGCNGLRSLMTLSIAESMVNLTTMKIEDCKKLEEIIEEEQVEEEKDRMVFSQLHYLALHYLPSLTCFCFGKLYTLEFSSLKRVDMVECPNMKTFSHGELRTPILHKVSVRDGSLYYEECWEGDLNSTIQQLFKRRQTKRTSRNDLRGELPST